MTIHGYRFAALPEWIIDHPTLPDRAVRLFAALQRYAGSDDSAHPFRRTLAERLHRSVDSIDRAMAELVEVGAVVVVERTHPQTRERTANDYFLWPMLPGDEATSPQDRGEVAAEARPRGRDDAAPNKERESEKESQRKETPPTPPQGGESDGEFARFWSTYPRRVGKAAAAKAWAKAVRTATPERIIAAAEVYARAMRGREVQFIAHPSSWLNAGRWDDDPAALAPRTSTRSAMARPTTDRSGESGRIIL